MFYDLHLKENYDFPGHVTKNMWVILDISNLVPGNSKESESLSDFCYVGWENSFASFWSDQIPSWV